LEEVKISRFGEKRYRAQKTKIKRNKGDTGRVTKKGEGRRK
jgi:hypothetical protein